VLEHLGGMCVCVFRATEFCHMTYAVYVTVPYAVEELRVVELGQASISS
jgi:hypothetical protein